MLWKLAIFASLVTLGVAFFQKKEFKPEKTFNLKVNASRVVVAELNTNDLYGAIDIYRGDLAILIEFNATAPVHVQLFQAGNVANFKLNTPLLYKQLLWNADYCIFCLSSRYFVKLISDYYTEINITLTRTHDFFALNMYKDVERFLWPRPFFH
ncbi:unnamed protein product [Caenorhabditis sp. 36 PRJEB53466]|nr:unnamed protein product [Caenorhabditis sp. 36 PRJEB53466]